MIHYTIKFKIVKTPEFVDWLENETAKSQVQIESRLSHIEEAGHFGEHKDLDDNVWELKWKNARRIYDSYIPERKILLLLGGNKNGQDKDIRFAKKILQKHITQKK